MSTSKPIHMTPEQARRILDSGLVPSVSPYYQRAMEVLRLSRVDAPLHSRRDSQPEY